MGDDLKKMIGSRIRAARQAKNLTPEQLAEVADKSVAALSNLERGKRLPSLEALIELAGKLDLRLSDLFEDIHAPPPSWRIQREARLRSLVREIADNDLDLAIAQMEALAVRARGKA